MDNFLLTLLGLSFFFSVHYLIRKCLVLFWKSVLTEASIYVIACRCVSAIQGLVSFFVGLIVARSCSRDIMKDVHWLTNAYVYFGMPYFLYDLWAMYTYNIRVHEKSYSSLPTVLQRLKKFVSQNVLMVTHHVVLPAVLSPVLLLLRENRGDYFFGVFYMFEIVIPFISAREILVQLQLKDTRLYVLTSISLMVVFFFARLAIFPFLYYSYADLRFLEVPLNIPVKCNVSSLLLLLPQIYWFSLMIRALCRGLQRLSSKGKPNQQ